MDSRNINNLPNEILLNILYNFRNLELLDLINIYNCFKKYRKIINDDIDILKINNKSYLSNIFNDIMIEEYIKGYYNEDEYENEDDYKSDILEEEIDRYYDFHIICKKYIKKVLFCNICNYIYDKENSKYIYYCNLCNKKICENCITIINEDDKICNLCNE